MTTGTVHIYAPQATAKEVKVAHCPDCKKRTRMLMFFTPWYGWDSTCIRCGRHWSDGECMPLEFARNARLVNINGAKRRFRAMPPRNKNHWGID